MQPRSAVPRVGLFVTCLVDMFRPSVGHAAARLIEEAGCAVEAPLVQNCCGQPAHSAGDMEEARDTAERTIAAFEAYDYVVAPSSACTAMLKNCYPALLAEDACWAPRATVFAAKVHELTAFLSDVVKLEGVSATHEGPVTWHDSCGDPGAAHHPRTLLEAVQGLELKEMPRPQYGCGSCGHTRAMPRTATNALAERKVAAIEASGATLVLGDDLGCLMGMAGRLKRKGSRVAARHVAEILAGVTDVPPIGSAGKAA